MAAYFGGHITITCSLSPTEHSSCHPHVLFLSLYICILSPSWFYVIMFLFHNFTSLFPMVFHFVPCALQLHDPSLACHNAFRHPYNHTYTHCFIQVTCPFASLFIIIDIYYTIHSFPFTGTCTTGLTGWRNRDNDITKFNSVFCKQEVVSAVIEGALTLPNSPATIK